MTPKHTGSVPPARERLAELQAALYGAKITNEERREHDRQVAAQAARDLDSRTIEAEFRDCLEFAKAHGLSGTPKYRREAARCLSRAAHLSGPASVEMPAMRGTLVRVIGDCLVISQLRDGEDPEEVVVPLSYLPAFVAAVQNAGGCNA